MRFSLYLLLFSVNYVLCKNNVNSLTQSMGQEIIEIGAPVKEDIPPELDEEPAPEFEDEDVSVPPKPVKKSTTAVLLSTINSDADDITKDDLISDDDETKVEKELAEVYKDNDYKASEILTEDISTTRKQFTLANVEEDKPIARAPKTSFVFQPDVNDKADIERFRTSIDEISCEKRVTQRLSEDISHKSDVSNLLPVNTITMGLAILSFLICQ